jgi:hypothetical protein
MVKTLKKSQDLLSYSWPILIKRSHKTTALIIGILTGGWGCVRLFFTVLNKHNLLPLVFNLTQILRFNLFVPTVILFY